VVAAVPLVDAAGVEGLAIGDVVTTTVRSHPTVTAGGGRGTPEGLILGVIAPGATLSRGGLDDG